MTGKKLERWTHADAFEHMRGDQVVVKGENGGLYVFSKTMAGLVRFDRSRSSNVTRSEINTMREKAVNLFSGKLSVVEATKV